MVKLGKQGHLLCSASPVMSNQSVYYHPKCEGRADKIQEPLIQREEDGMEGRGSDTAEYHPGQSQLTTFKNH